MMETKMLAAYAYKWITDTWIWGEPIMVFDNYCIKDLIIRGLVDAMVHCGEPESFRVFSTKDNGATMTEEFRHDKSRKDNDPQWPKS